ncbi:hypothetical protein E4T46_03761 [Aureobasidium subglaciale]|nr:hypothetical protein E4T40_03920 [Aureobasidium subglaciale]KAI5227829.1 hypothetical protein E4T41_04140 [Aureobasidium subglaciale]KAI5263299.1 hypothetical protein E4T46_03761 [Aureobasidium subglaciale]
MPKRPCAVLVTPDNKTILCGDKFGDVYSLPLFPSATTEQPEESTKVEMKEDGEQKKYVPAATTLTVHSGRNRRALENQMKQKDLQAKVKDGPKFEHQLLLGHVSMLTDVQFASEMVDGRSRGYIITTDRDEHIRVSRGPPQAHVIERFCLGHKEFISKICLLPNTDLLVSGGGDDWLGVWDWKAGELKDKRDLRSALTSLFSSQPSTFRAENSIAVSGLWAVSMDAEAENNAILVACENLPCLLISQSPLSSRAPKVVGVNLPGVPLDITVVGNIVVVSMDVAEAYSISTNELETKLEPAESFNVKLHDANQLMHPAPEREQLDDLLFGIGNLRKRGAPEEAQDDAPDQAKDGAINED